MLEVDRFGAVTRLRMCTVIEGMAPYWVASYLVGGFLIDTGCATCVDELIAAVESAGRGLPLAVNTHYHEDHIAANVKLQERFGTRILAHPEAVPLIAQAQPIPGYRAMCWGVPAASRVEPIGPEVFAGGHRFLAIETPGHTHAHVSLVEPEEGWCFSGDLYTGPKPRVAWKETEVVGMAASLRRLAAEARPGRPLTLFTGPGEVIENAAPVLLDCAVYIEDLLERAGPLRASGAGVGEARQRLLGSESSFSFLTEGEFSVTNLARALLEAAG